MGIDEPSLGTVTYLLQVIGRDGEHVVRRRYSSFAVLEDIMESANLPPMPPRSFFRKNFSERFKLERSMALRAVVRAAVCADPYAVTPVLRWFLGLAAPRSCEVPHPTELRRLLQLSAMDDLESFIAEGDCETSSNASADILGCDVERQATMSLPVSKCVTILENADEIASFDRGRDILVKKCLQVFLEGSGK